VIAKFAELEDIPMSLIEQKPELHIDGLREMFSYPGTFAFTLHDDDGEMVGVTWMQHGKVYDQVFIDSLIIDSKHRSLDTLRKALKLSFSLAMGVAEETGANAVVTNVRVPRLLRKMFPGTTEVSRTLKMEVTQCRG